MTREDEIQTLAPWRNELPAGWSACRLDSVSDILFSNVDKHTVEEETPVKLCNYVDVYHNDVINDSIAFMRATADQREINRFQIRPGDTLVTKDSEIPDDIAIPALVAQELPGVLCGYHLALIRPRSKRIMGEFLAWVHRSKQFRAQYEAKAVGVTRFGLSQYAFKSSVIPLPPINEQRRIHRYLHYSCSAIDSIAWSDNPNGQEEESSAVLNQQMRILWQYKNSLIHECVTGQRRITDADIEKVGRLDTEEEKL